MATSETIAPIRVVHVEAGRHLYGGALQVKYLLQGLNNYPVHNILVCPPDSHIEHACLDLAAQQSNIQVVPTPLNGDLDWRMCSRIREVIRDYQADTVHIHSRRGADIWAAWAGKQCKKSVLLTRRVDNTEPRWFARWKYNHWYDGVVCISDGIQKVLIDEGVDQRRVKTIRSVVDTDFCRVAPDRAWFDQTFSYANDDIVIGVVAQLIERKGHKVLFEALKPIFAKNKRVQLMVLGKGPLRQTLQDWVREQQLEQRIRFFGFRDDIQRVLPNLYLVAHPAFTEGLGVALLQAAACGVPVVASSVGGIPEAVADQEHGLLVSPNNVQQLTLALQRLIQNPELRNRWGVKARERMVNEFSIAAMAKQYFDIYKNLR